MADFRPAFLDEGFLVGQQKLTNVIESLKAAYGTTLLLDIRQVAELCGVSPRSIWGWADDRKFPQPIKLGRLRRWSLADVQSWIAEQSQAAQAKAVSNG